MKLTNVECKKVAENISNPMYSENLQATKELIELFDKISRKPLKTVEDYVKFYDDNFYTFSTWEALVESEKGQSDGFTEIECEEQLNKNISIWQLPCGWYVQCI